MLRLTRFALLCPVLFTGCAVPKLEPKPLPLAPETLASAQSIPPGTAAWPAADWWNALRDPQLGALISEALKTSPDVAAAAARIRSADALREQAGAALGPTGSLEAFAGGNKQSENLGIPPQFIPNGIQDTGRITGTFGFDLDLWGRNRAALAATTSEAQAARVDYAQAALMLSTGIASAYADLQQQYARRDVALSTVAVREATARLTAQRVGQGLDARGAQAQADTRIPAARADVAALDEAIVATRHRIAALVGAGPDRGLTIAPPMLSTATPGLPPDARIDLIGRRPDVVAARLRAEAAASRIKQARADFYPNLNLSAIVGLQSLGLGKLFEARSSYGTAGAAFSLPLFDLGRIAGRYRGARATYDEAVARYNSTLLQALREAADAYASAGAIDAQLAQQRRSLASAQEAARLATLRYKEGLSNQLPVLTAEDSVLVAQRAVADLEARRIANAVALVRALGGGFSGVQR